MIAALYVLKNGPYFGIDGVDPWDEERDARKYRGPHPPQNHINNEKHENEEGEE